MTPTASNELERLQAADPLQDRVTEGAPADVLLSTIQSRLAEASGGRRPEPLVRRPSNRRVVPVALLTAGLIGTATVGYAVLGDRESVSIGCQYGDGMTVINAVSSDPIADCVARLATTGITVAPEDLTTYVNESGLVVVAPDRATAQQGVVDELSPAPDLRINTDTAELRMAIDDLVTGVGDCSDPETVTERAKGIADRLGFGAWDVTERDRPAEADCGWAAADVEGQQIIVMYREQGDGTPSALYAEIMDVSQQIHSRVDHDCLTAAEAEEVAKSAVADTSQANTTQITVNEDADADCARVYTNAYGGYEITIFGP